MLASTHWEGVEIELTPSPDVLFDFFAAIFCSWGTHVSDTPTPLFFAFTVLLKNYDRVRMCVCVCAAAPRALVCEKKLVCVRV